MNQKTEQVKKLVIAIDGMAATGKGVLSKAIAKKYQLIAIDSGKIYRYLAYCLTESGIIDEKFEKLSKQQIDQYNAKILEIENYAHQDFLAKFEANLAKNTQIYSSKNSSSDDVKNEQLASKYLNFLYITNLQQPKIASLASILAKNEKIREIILEILTKLIYDMKANFNGCVIDGRDIGTVVAPFADYKFFLTADPYVRARRRYLEQKKLGFYEKTKVQPKKFENKPTKSEEIKKDKINNKDIQAKELENQLISKLLAEIKERDERDKKRKIAPCIPAKDAILIDTSQMSEQEVLIYASNKINQH